MIPERAVWQGFIAQFALNKFRGAFFNLTRRIEWELNKPERPIDVNHTTRVTRAITKGLTDKRTEGGNRSVIMGMLVF